MFQSHGYLSSANCHVDSRWVLKISGFALHAFREDKQADQVDSDCNNLVMACMMTAVAVHHRTDAYASQDRRGRKNIGVEL